MSKKNPSRFQGLMDKAQQQQSAEESAPPSSDPEEKVQLNVQVPASLDQRFRVCCARHRLSLSQAAQEALLQWVQEREE